MPYRAALKAPLFHEILTPSAPCLAGFHDGIEGWISLDATV
jgi:hypothetical protein